jgi:hypothetical protein
MKLMGRDVDAAAVLSFVQDRLAARGLSPTPTGNDAPANGVEPRVDPLSFNLDALSEHADATRGLPIESHRDGLSGRLVVAAKQAFRAAGQIFINEALGRQSVFNGHVRDSYAQLSSEVLRLRARLAELEAKLEPVVPPPRTSKKPRGERD